MVAGVFFVVGVVIVILLLRGSGDKFEQAQIEDLFDRPVTCTTESDDGVGEWNCTSANGEATVEVGADGGYSSSATALPAPFGCCLKR